jgi:hypothetical protein
MKLYQLITGRHIDVSRLTTEEKRFLSDISARYQHKPKWNEFASFWVARFNDAGLAESSPAYRICQDLEARLGIPEGKVSLPTYRDYLADLIEEKYGSRYKFCKETGIDQGHLSRVLAGHGDLSVGLLARILDKANAVLIIKPCDEFRLEAECNRPNDVLAEIAETGHRGRASA